MPLLERDAELSVLEERWSRARTHAGSLVLVSGDAGVGKTALVRAFTDTVGDEAVVLWGACDPLSTPRPIGPLRDVAPQLGAAVLERITTGAAAHETFAAVFAELCGSPHLFVVDDLHWADQGTIDFLRFLLRRIRTTRSLVVGTFREDELGAGHALRGLLGDAARSDDAVCVSLGPLSVDAVTAMIGSRAIDPAWLHGATGGNSFFVSEVLAHGPHTLPMTIRDAVLARTTDLGVDARDLLDLLACAPGGLPDRLLATMRIGMEPLRELDEAGLVERDRRGLAFRHELCRLAVASAIPPGGEVALHVRMLEALEADEETDPAVLVHHALAAGDAGRVRRHATRAGIASARAGAHTQAATFFEAALDRGAPTTPAERAELLELLGAELYLIDRLPDAITSCDDARQIRTAVGDRCRVGADLHDLSLYEWYSANRAVSEEHASAAVAVLEPDVDLVGLGHAYAMEAYLALQANALDRARSFHDRGRRISQQVADHRLDVRLEIIAGACSILSGDTAGRDRLLAAVEGSDAHFDEIQSSGYSNVAYLDVEQRRLPDAAAVLAVSLPLTRERDVPICNVWQLGARARLGLLTGDWDAAVADADEVLGGRGAQLARTWPHLVRGLVALRRGDAATDDLDAAWSLASRFGEPLRLLPAAAALAERAWLDGDTSATSHLAELLDELDGVEGLEWSRGDLAVWLRRIDPRVEVPVTGVADPYRLLLSGDPGSAADLWDELGSPYDRALALVDTGVAEHAFLALVELDRLGAVAVADKVRQDLREAGVEAVPARRRATTLANPAGLTARQVEVLALLAEGLTNAELAARLYISPKTADHHVSAILSKLQVANRREAAAAARGLGLAT